MPSCDYPTHPPSPALSEAYLTMAPSMPTVPLPPFPDQPSSHHRGLMTPPPSIPHVHPVLSAESTVVRYDLARDPQTIRMSSSSHDPFFPSYDPASSPSASVLHVRCEATGHTITVHTCNGAVTCHDLMVQLHRFFERDMGREEWRNVKGAMKSAMKKAYERRAGFAYSGSARMKRIDYLLGRTTFKRIVPEYGDSMWLLQTC